tara:strand:- start:2256 stop:3575 length:1320 start_codon:yes stop_codon:yes gene_type:complete
MSKLTIPTAEIFQPLLGEARYKGAHGGRGSGKSHFFAELAIERCLMWPGYRIVCVREVQRSLKESVKRLLEDKIDAMNVADDFTVLNDRIDAPGGGIILFQGMQDHTAESVKSLEGFDVGYVEEAQTMLHKSLEMLRPTIRQDKDPTTGRPGSELWFSWNPRDKKDPVDKLLRGVGKPPDSVVVEANYRDNPFFPHVLDEERLFDKEHKAERYPHVWEGDYEPAVYGAIYGDQLAKARRENRITAVHHDKAVQTEVWYDLGHSDATAMWFVQIVSNEIHLIDYYENHLKDLDHYAGILDEKADEEGYRYSRQVWPHDGGAKTLASGGRPLSDLFKDLGYPVEIQDQTGVWAGIQRVRQIFDRIWIDEDKCGDGLDALKSYRVEEDEKRGTEETKYFKDKPHHDWASHGADALRTGAMARPYRKRGKVDYPANHISKRLV